MAVSQALPSESMRDLILATHPELSGVPFIIHEAGWDSVAVDAGGEYIFKFPRNPDAVASLEKEARLLAVVRPQISMTVPDLTILPGPPSFFSDVNLFFNPFNLFPQFLHPLHSVLQLF